MQILVSGEESVVMSIHYDHGLVPDITVVNSMANRICTNEIIIGKVTIQIFERAKNEGQAE